jgi:TnsA-like endonuclease N terminal
MEFEKDHKAYKPTISKFPSLKNSASEWCASALELDMIYLLEIDPDVVSYKTQPFKIRYLLDKKPHTYTPDIYVARKNRRQIIEVKRSSKAETEEFTLFAKTVTPIFESEGCEYIVATEKTIRLEPKLSNIKLLFRYARTPISTDDQARLYQFFRDKADASLKEIIDLFSHREYRMQLVYAFLYWGILEIDVNQVISSDTNVRISLSGGVKEALHESST